MGAQHTHILSTQWGTPRPFPTRLLLSNRGTDKHKTLAVAQGWCGTVAKKKGGVTRRSQVVIADHIDLPRR